MSLIHYTKKQKVRRAVPVLLSLFFTGAGQVYNGFFARGAALLLLRTILLLLCVLLAVKAAGPPLLYTPHIVLFFAFLVSAAAPIEAFLSAPTRRYIKSRFITSSAGIILFSITASLLTAISVFMNFSVYSAVTVQKEQTPFCGAGDILLVNRVQSKSFIKGALIYHGNTVGRVTAMEGDRVKLDKNAILINGKELLRREYTDGNPEYLNSDLKNKVVAEENGPCRYPVTGEISREGRDVFPLTISKDELFVVTDNRELETWYHIIPKSAVKGRVEGILYSPVLLRITVPPHRYFPNTGPKIK